jgi:hypothetical protein
MKTRVHLAVLFMLSSAPAWAAAAEPINVAVCDFRSFRPRAKREFADMIIGSLSKDPRIVALDRGQLDKLLAEQAIDLARDLDPGTAAQVGRLTGAAAIVTGVDSGVQPDESFTVIVRITATATGRAFVEEARGRRAGPGTITNDRLPVAAELSRKIINTIFAHEADFAGARPDSREARIAAIVTATQGGKRPAVSLRFTAAQPAQAAPATATVETELGLIFQRAGFVVVDEKSQQPPDVEIAGDVVADPGTKLGPLFTCRAVINARAIERTSGRLLAFDRQTSDGTDVGAQTAMSAALEAAADALAARLVPLLSR